MDRFAQRGEIIHIDIDPSSISKNIKVHIPIVGDCKRVLRKLIDAVRDELKEGVPAAVLEGRKQWATQVAEWKRDFPLRYDWDDDVIKPQYDAGDLEPHARGGADATVGCQHQMWRPRTTGYNPRSWCHVGWAREMGYGFRRDGRACGNPEARDQYRRRRLLR